MSAAIALRDDGFRDPPRTVVAPPAVAEAPAPAALPPARPTTAPRTGTGPSIIQVRPPTEPGGNVVVIRDPSALSFDPRTAHLPVQELLEESAHGPLPVRAADGRRPFDVYAGRWSGTRGAKVALVIGGLGLSQTGTQSAIAALPPEVTLAFASQGNSLPRWMQAARREGHEVLLQVPMEPFDYPAVDPGRNALTVAGAGEANADSLHWALGRMTNYVGIMNHMGGRLVTERDAFAPVMQEIGQRGLLYLDDGSSARSLAPELARASAAPFAAADTVIDGARDRGAILKMLDQVEATARAKGSAIGVGSAFDITVEAVAAWINEAKRRGIEIVPVSALASDPEREQ